MKSFITILAVVLLVGQAAGETIGNPDRLPSITFDVLRHSITADHSVRFPHNGRESQLGFEGLLKVPVSPTITFRAGLAVVTRTFDGLLNTTTGIGFSTTDGYSSVHARIGVTIYLRGK
ncbi:MAG: hypothetical protein WC455_12100 [Dehalococcoidia bacterium]|jgi:hypothetical protein